VHNHNIVGRNVGPPHRTMSNSERLNKCSPNGRNPSRYGMHHVGSHDGEVAETTALTVVAMEGKLAAKVSLTGPAPRAGAASFDWLHCDERADSWPINPLTE
jgi:hypothetical protein